MACPCCDAIACGACPDQFIADIPPFSYQMYQAWYYTPTVNIPPCTGVHTPTYGEWGCAGKTFARVTYSSTTPYTIGPFILKHNVKSVDPLIQSLPNDPECPCCWRAHIYGGEIELERWYTDNCDDYIGWTCDDDPVGIYSYQRIELIWALEVAMTSMRTPLGVPFVFMLGYMQFFSLWRVVESYIEGDCFCDPSCSEQGCAPLLRAILSIAGYNPVVPGMPFGGCNTPPGPTTFARDPLNGAYSAIPGFPLSIPLTITLTPYP